ncbi:MAG: hypothetical protein RLZZ568_2006, partial [Cyanobacteriota bacterium]
GTGFGNVRNLTVLAVEVAETRTFGRICNTGNQQLQVKSLKFELEDLANPKKGESLETQSVNFRDPYYVEPGQQFEFEGSRLALRGRVPGQVTVKLVDWN